MPFYETCQSALPLAVPESSRSCFAVVRVCVLACVRCGAHPQAFEASPGKGMMVEYPHLPNGIVTTVLPDHFKVEVSDSEKDRMMATTRMYSKVRVGIIDEGAQA